MLPWWYLLMYLFHIGQETETFLYIAMVSLFAMAMTGGLLPIKLGKVPGAKKFLSLGNMFSGGVFLGGGLLHLLPESNEVLFWQHCSITCSFYLFSVTYSTLIHIGSWNSCWRSSSLASRFSFRLPPLWAWFLRHSPGLKLFVLSPIFVSLHHIFYKDFILHRLKRSHYIPLMTTLCHPHKSK